MYIYVYMYIVDKTGHKLQIYDVISMTCQIPLVYVTFFNEIFNLSKLHNFNDLI